MKKLLFFAIVASSLALVSCNDSDNDDVVQKPNREGAVEVAASTQQYKDSTIVLLHYDVYKNNTLVSTKVITDTVPGLGTTVTEGEDSEGNTQNLTVPKQYEFYITVK